MLRGFLFVGAAWARWINVQTEPGKVCSEVTMTCEQLRDVEVVLVFCCSTSRCLGSDGVSTFHCKRIPSAVAISPSCGLSLQLRVVVLHRRCHLASVGRFADARPPRCLLAED
ncbi:hypothetical protein HHI36_019538 [Cryptolaemus montrouzieri]|uniref:Secreted protein n=1 Tax=Cryptolaemus montrouzieri TaxID=559131 RepID=A0ABD2N953_9CUCU